MNALLIIAHGSRRRQANAEIEQLVERLRVLSTGSYAIVKHAFLEFAEPTIDETIAELVAAGCRQVVVFPYFLSAGSHVSIDIPAAIDKARRQYPPVTFRITRHLGDLEAVATLILQQGVSVI